MTSSSTAQIIDETILAWDMYCAGDFEEIKKNFQASKNEEIKDILLLANLEKSRARHPVMLADRSLFSPLVAAIAAYNSGDHSTACGILGDWLLNKNFFSANIMERFVEAADRTGDYETMYRVATKYADWKKYDEVIAGPLFTAAFGMARYNEVVKIYSKYSKHLQDVNNLQKLGFSLIQLGKYSEAEKLLMAAYKRETGEEYQISIGEIKKKYEATIKDIPSLEKRTDRSFDESWQLGMAYFLDSKYDDALRIFKSIV